MMCLQYITFRNRNGSRRGGSLEIFKDIQRSAATLRGWAVFAGEPAAKFFYRSFWFSLIQGKNFGSGFQVFCKIHLFLRMS